MGDGFRSGGGKPCLFLWGGDGVGVFHVLLAGLNNAQGRLLYSRHDVFKFLSRALHLSLQVMMAQQRSISRLLEAVNSRHEHAQQAIAQLTNHHVQPPSSNRCDRAPERGHVADAPDAAYEEAAHRQSREGLIQEFRDAAVSMAVDLSGKCGFLTFPVFPLA